MNYKNMWGIGTIRREDKSLDYMRDSCDLLIVWHELVHTIPADWK